MSQSLAVITPVVPGRTFLFPGVVGLVHVVASLLAVLALNSPLRDLLGLGKDVTSLVPLICSDLGHLCTGRGTWTKLDCGPPPCLGLSLEFETLDLEVSVLVLNHQSWSLYSLIM